MKIRSGFVSNSSSSSFLVAKSILSENQIEKIKNHIEHGDAYAINWSSPENGWLIEDTGEMLKGYTSMDNFDMMRFMERIGVDTQKVEWDE